MSDEGQEAFGAPTRVAFAPRRGWLYVTDSSQDRIVVLNIPRLAPNLVPPRPLRRPGRRVEVSLRRPGDAAPVEQSLSRGRCRSCARTARASTLLAVLLLLEIVLGALQPWPLKVVIDYVLHGTSVPGTDRGLARGDHGRPRRSRCSSSSWSPACCCRSPTSSSSMYGTQVQVDTGQRMVYDLRYRLFEHLQSLGLHHHVTTSTGDAVYRVDVDSYSIENLVMSGIFPLATSVITLVVMFAILAKLDVTVALLSLTRRPVPVPVPALLHDDARAAARSASRSSSRS